MRTLDLLVIGTGSAAGTIATACADKENGWRIGIVDAQPYGGTCALRGCNPKKVLVRMAELADWARRMEGKGFHAENVGMPWGSLIEFKRTFTRPVTEAFEKKFAEHGVERFHGHASFQNPRIVAIGDETIDCERVAICAGSAPIKLGISGEEHLTTSEQFLETETLPPRILFVGGGYISFEFAHVAARAGAEVTILEMGDRPLAHFDPDLVNRLVDAGRDVGIELQTKTKVEAVEKTAKGVLRVATVSDGKRDQREAEMVVHGAGRAANVEGLGLEAAEVEYTKKGILVNEYLQSVSNPAVYAAGDVADSGAPPLTPTAEHEGEIVAANLLEGNHRQVSYRGVPSACFSVPALASVGMQEEDARREGLSLRVREGDWSGWNSMRKVGEAYAYYKILIDNESGNLLGAHLLGAGAAETINIFAIAMQLGIRAEALKSFLLVFPTFAYDTQRMI